MQLRAHSDTQGIVCFIMCICAPLMLCLNADHRPSTAAARDAKLCIVPCRSTLAHLVGISTAFYSARCISSCAPNVATWKPLPPNPTVFHGRGTVSHFYVSK